MGRRIWTDGEIYRLLDYLRSNIYGRCSMQARIAKRCLDEAVHKKPAQHPSLRRSWASLKGSHKAYKKKQTNSSFGDKVSRIGP